MRICILIATIFCLTNYMVAKELEQIKLSKSLKKELQAISDKVLHVAVNLDFKGKNYEIFYTGCLIDEKGHFIIPFSYPKKDVTSVKAWYKGNETKVKIIDENNSIRILLLKIDNEESYPYFKPLTIPLSTLGTKLITHATFGENNFHRSFQDFGHFLNYQFGQIDSLIIGGINFFQHYSPGAPIVTSEGTLAGILSDDRTRLVFAYNDLHKKVRSMLKKAIDPEKKENTKKDKDPYVGIFTMPINKNYTKLMKLPSNSVYVTAILDGSPGHKAGMQAGDLITAVDDVPLQGDEQLSLRYFYKLLDPQIDETVKLTLMRNKKELEVELTFVEAPEAKERKEEDLGITISEILPSQFYSNHIFAKEGIVIKTIEPGSPAATSSEFGSTLLSINDVILELEEQPVTTIENFVSILTKAKEEKKNIILFKVKRGISTHYVALKLSEKKD